MVGWWGGVVGGVVWWEGGSGGTGLAEEHGSWLSGVMGSIGSMHADGLWGPMQIVSKGNDEEG